MDVSAHFEVEAERRSRDCGYIVVYGRCGLELCGVWSSNFSCEVVRFSVVATSYYSIAYGRVCLMFKKMFHTPTGVEGEPFFVTLHPHETRSFIGFQQKFARSLRGGSGSTGL